MKRSVYLDNAATSYPKPGCVYGAVIEFMRHGGGNPGRGQYPRARDAELLVLETRAALARLFGIADPTRIVFTANSTEALNVALKGWLRPGDHVVTTNLEHNAVRRPLQTLQEERGVRVTVVDADPDGDVDPQAIRAALEPATRLVACTHASNVLGAILPIAEIGAVAHAAGVPLLVDASQTAGALPIDVQALHVDFLAFTGHKSLLGPTGTGGLYLAPGYELHSLKEGGTGTRSEDAHQPADMPDHLESGTPNTFGLAGLRAAVQYLEETGVERIRAHEVRLNRQLMASLRGLDGIQVYGAEDPARKVGLTTINFVNLDPTEVAQMLAQQFGIECRAGLHCAPGAHAAMGTGQKGAVRFGIGYFNTEEDVRHVARACAEILQVLYRR